jgi:hypothetical protein
MTLPVPPSVQQTATDWLDQLAPDRAPPPPGWWPPAPGWWALAALLLVALAALLWWWRMRQRAVPRWQRLARKALRQLEAQARAGVDDQGRPLDDAALAQQLQGLLRRYAVARYGRDRVAGLSGDAWVAFVAAHGGTDWIGDAGRQLLRLAYGGRAAQTQTQTQTDGASGAAPNTASAGSARAVPANPQRARWFAGARAFVEARG